MPEIEIPEIREIAPPLPPDTSWPLWVWVAIAAGAILIIAGFIALIRKSRSLPAPRTAYDGRHWALTKLHELKEDYLRLPAPEFALQASYALRLYLTSHYGQTTPFETGSEFLDRQEQNHLMGEEKFHCVQELFDRAEILKFAPAPGADSQRLELVQDLIAFVRDDVPGPQLKPAAPASDADPVPA